MLPTAFLSGLLLIRRNEYGFLLAPVFLNFLVLMMTAIGAKIIGQAFRGVEGTLPVIFAFLGFALIAASSSFYLLRNMKEGS